MPIYKDCPAILPHIKAIVIVLRLASAALGGTLFNPLHLQNLVNSLVLNAKVFT